MSELLKETITSHHASSNQASSNQARHWSLHNAIPLRTRRRQDCWIIYRSKAISNCISFLSTSIVVPKWHTERSTSKHQHLLNWCSYGGVTQFSEAVWTIFEPELKYLCLLPLIAVNFHGNIVNSFVSGGNYGYTSVWCVVLWSHKVCSIAIQRKIEYSLVANSTLWWENKVHYCTLWNIQHTFSLWT